MVRSALCSAGCGRSLATFNMDETALILCESCHPADLSMEDGKHDRDACEDCQRLIAAGSLPQ